MAQDDRSKLKFGLKAGANISNIYDKTGEVFTADNKIGFTGGIFLGIPIGKFLGLQPEVLFFSERLQILRNISGSYIQSN